MEKNILGIIDYLVENNLIINYHFFQNGKSVQIRLPNKKVYTLMAIELCDLRFDHTKQRKKRNRL